MKIYVLGSSGMLGKYVSTYLSEKYNIVKVTRKELDASNASEENIRLKFKQLNVNSNDVIINCIGVIKPVVDSLGDLNAIKINSIFPRILADTATQIGARLIHPTTDCVFTGKRGLYTEIDIHDISDTYGRSKSLGEPANCAVIRTSIIGEEVDQQRSLVEWVKSQNNNTVNGFTNHFWNGVTCLQFAKICDQIIKENLFWIGVKHIFSNIVSKKELLELIILNYNLNINIVSVDAQEACDRSLSSISQFYKQFNIPPLSEQIKEMAKFSKKLYNT